MPVSNNMIMGAVSDATVLQPSRCVSPLVGYAGSRSQQRLMSSNMPPLLTVDRSDAPHGSEGRMMARIIWLSLLQTNNGLTTLSSFTLTAL